MILTCSQCSREYDVSGTAPGAAIQCECGDLLIAPEFADLQGAVLVKKYIELLAKEEGLPPEGIESAQGWEFQRGTARVVLSYDAEEDLLSIESPIMPLPVDEAVQHKLANRLLELNYRETRLARFAVHNEQVVVSFARDTVGLDYPEFHHAVECVCRTADDYDDVLRSEFLGEDRTAVEDDEVIDLTKL